MATAVTDSPKYHFNTAKGMSGLHDIHSSLTTAGIDADGGSHYYRRNRRRESYRYRQRGRHLHQRLKGSPKSYLPLYATTLQKTIIRMMPNPINPRFLRIYRIPQRTLEKGEAYPIHSSRHKPHRPRDRPSRGSYVASFYRYIRADFSEDVRTRRKKSTALIVYRMAPERAVAGVDY
jgi:hypothetical protein